MNIGEYIEQLENANLTADQIINILKSFKTDSIEIAKREEQKAESKERKADRRKKFSIYRQSGSDVFYVDFRYKDTDKEKIIKRSTGKTTEAEAQKWAFDNMSKCITEYEMKRKDLLKILLEYYQKDSEYQQNDKALRKELTDNQRIKFLHAMENRVVPFFEKKGIYAPHQVDKPIIEQLRLHLIKDCGLSANTANDYMTALRKVFAQLTMSKVISADPFSGGLTRISHDSTRTKRGSFNEREMKNFFRDLEWQPEEKFLLLLCAIAYYTGMRNGEIVRIQPDDFFKERDFVFLNVRGTKTENAVRVVPVCSFLYEKITEYITEKNISAGQTLFEGKKRMDREFGYAYKLVGHKLGYSDDEMNNKYITFYSFRHLYKTILTRADIDNQLVEYFMGHSEGKDVRRSYFNSSALDFVEKAKPIFDILENV